MSSTTASNTYRVIVDDMTGLVGREMRIAPHIRVVEPRKAAWAWLADLVYAAEIASTLSVAERKNNWMVANASEWMEYLRALGVKVHIETVPHG